MKLLYGVCSLGMAIVGLIKMFKGDSDWMQYMILSGVWNIISPLD
jgi:hypothetical protein